MTDQTLLHQEFEASRSQLFTAFNNPPRMLIDYQIKRYGSITIETNDGNVEIPVKPKQLVIVEWVIRDGIKEPSSIELSGIRVLPSWNGLKLQRWLDRNATPGVYHK